MPFPTLDDLAAFTSSQRQVLEQFVAYVFGFLSVEHKDDGTHGDVTADTITLATPTSPVAGNVRSDLIPATTDTYSLGTAYGEELNGHAMTAWKDLYLSGTFGMGEVPSGGVAPVQVVAVTDVVAGDRTTTLNGATGPGMSWSIVSPDGTTLVRFGGSTTIGPTTTDDKGVTINAIAVTGAIGAGGAMYERGRTVALGEWTAVTHNAANFTASAGTWTVDAGDQLEYTYMLVGKTMWLKYHIATTDVSNAGVTLKLAIPGGFTGAARTQRMLHVASDNGGALAIARAEVTSGASVVDLYSDLAGTGFAITAGDNTLVNGTLAFEVA